MTNKFPLVVVGGAGGGKGGSSGGATEAANTLRSKQVAHIIDLLGEGEWEGLVDGPGGIYLNDVSLFTPTSPTGDVASLSDISSDDSTSWSPAGTWNFKGVTVEFRNGTQSQSAIRVASALSTVQVVNLQVRHDTPIIANITNPNVDLAVVNVQVDQLYQQDTTNGNISGYHVDIEIQVRHGSGAWTSVKTDRIDGKTMGPYVRAYSIDLHAISPSSPWDVKVIRTSADDPDSSKHSLITFVGMDLMSRDKFRYPNSALCSIGIDATQLGSIPTRAYDVKMTRIRIPANYNPLTRTYTGVWDGSFRVAWSDNPAWCLYDLITSQRYGLGEYVDESLVDKWALYTIGQYCDVLVPDGFGAMEPRFRLNVFIQTAEEAITVVQNLASVFRGIIYYLNESLTTLQDSPSDSVYQFNTTNVIDGIFSYAGASASARHTVAMVVWNNPDVNYKQDVESVEDPAGLLRFGYRPVTVQAFGCTSRGQAHRLGLWTLYVEQYEADVLTFSTAIEGTGIQPGNIIDVFDPTRANLRMGGRVIGVVGQTITPDKGVTVEAGTHQFVFVGDDGTLVTRDTTLGSGTHDTILLDGAGPVPSISSVFGMQTAGLESQQFRVIAIAETERHKYEITAVAYNSSKYAYVEDGLTLNHRPTRASTGPLVAPTGFIFTENLYLLADGSIRNKLIVGWNQNKQALNYSVSWRVGSGNWTPVEKVDSHQFTVLSVTTGWTYEFHVSANSLLGTPGIEADVTYVIVGERFPPPPFDYLDVETMDDGSRFVSYGYVHGEKPLDYKGAEIRYFAGITTDWDAMTPLGGDGFFTYSPIETGQGVMGHYTVAACAIDMTDVLSAPIIIEVDLGAGPMPVATIEDARHRIDAISSDNVLDRSEKRANQVLWNQIISYHDAKVPQATLVGLITERDAFVAAYDDLAAYLVAPFDVTTGYGVGLGGGDWNDVTTDSAIDGTVFRAKFDALFDTAETLDRALVGLAQLTADAAVTSVADAAARIDTIASDNMLSMGEKRANQILWQQIIDFHTQKDAEATAIGLTTEKTNFDAAYTELARYLTAAYNVSTGDGVGLGGGDWNDVTTDSVIDGSVFRVKFGNVFSTAEILTAAITAHAQSSADTALANAATAFASATTANTAITAINSAITAITADNVFSKSEKSATKVMFADIVAWHDAKIVVAGALGITTELTNFTTAYNELVRYLGAAYNSGTHDGVGLGGTDWSDVTTDSTIDGPTFRGKFNDVTSTAAILDTKINSTTNTNVATAQTTANTGVTNAAAAQFVADSAYGSVSDYIGAANAAITTTAADNVLATYEKPSIVTAQSDITTWQTALAARITTFSAAYPSSTVSRSAFDAAVTALNTYLTAVYNGGTLQGVGTGGTDWSNTATNSTIDGTTFRAKFATVYNAASALDAQLAITSVPGAMLSTLAPTAQAAATSQSTANDAATAAAAASASAALKLNKSASDTLSGVIATSAGGGIKTGTITWDSSGNLTGGTGVAVTNKGIVGANGGAATFSISATSGAVSVQGDITSGSTITGSTITGGIVRSASSGARVEISSNTLIATNSSGQNFVQIDNTGKVSFTGGGYDPSGAFLYGAAVAIPGTAANSTAIVGFYGYNAKSSGGQAVKGHSPSGNSTGVGVYALAEASTSVGALIQNTGGGVALQINGTVTLGNNVYTWNGYSYAAPVGSTTAVMHNDGVWRDPVTTARVNSAFGVAAANVCQLVVGDSGTANVSGAGLNLNTGTGVSGTYQFAASGNTLVLQTVSDIRLKQDVRDETLGLEFLSTVRPVSYRMKVNPTLVRHGFIADEIEQLVASDDALFHANPDGMKGVDYMSMIGILVKAVQELRQEVLTLKGQK